jgi:RNA polymerase sigma-70 factor (ECF subfamily)
MAEAFFEASRTGDLAAISGMLAEDVACYSDGGGKRNAAFRPLFGHADVLTLHSGLARQFAMRPSQIVRVGFINGLPGFVTLEADGILQTTALQIENGQVTAIYIMRNPEKLGHLTH